MRCFCAVPGAAMALLCLVAPAARSQDKTNTAGPTLAQALAQVESPRSDLYLTIGAETVRLPKDAQAPPAGATVPQVADAYGRMVHEYETVDAVAPARVTVVYAPPDTPNPYDGMPAGQVVKLLTGTFTKDQWKSFLGTSGVGYTEMSNDQQRSLFAALFPEGHLIIEKDNPTGPNDLATRQDLSGDALTQARLRLGYFMSLGLPVAGKPDTHTFGITLEPADAPTRYIMTNEQSYGADREYGGQVRETVDNGLKPTQLDADGAAFKAAVALDGVKTVDDLVARLAQATGREIYADARYGARTVTLLGPPKSARARDLLRALALCVGGTYRQVGPAYVLTDDVLGLGTKHALWKAFEEKAEALLPGQGNAFAAQPSSNIPYTIQDIGWGGDPLAFTPDQQKQFWAQWRSNSEQGGGPLDLTLPFNQLSPVQQEMARQIQQRNAKHHGDTTLDGTVMVQAEPLVQVTLPSLDGPVIVYDSYHDLLPYPHLTPAEQKAQDQRMAAQIPWQPNRADAPVSGPLRPLVQGFARRAVRLAPKTAQTLTKDFDSLQSLGFNEVWLRVSPNPTAKSDDAAVAMVTAAVKAGRTRGIVVLPELRLLDWGETTPVNLRDLDIRGLTASEADKTARFRSGDAHDTVTPFAPEVAGRLTALVGRLGALRGLGGMVWEDFTPPGYTQFTPDGPDDSFGDSLGFADAGRLAFLRWAHADPVDLYTNYYTDVRAKVSVPGFSEDYTQERALYDRWRGLRAHTGQALVMRLAATLSLPFRRATLRLPLLVPPANESFASIYGSWDDLHHPPPAETFITPKGPNGQPLMGVPVTEQMPGALSYHPVFFYASPNTTPRAQADAVARTLRQAAQQGQQNIVLDFTDKPGQLAALAEAERGTK